MAKRWDCDEDAFLLRWHKIGPEFIASHDLGRPESSGPRRLRHLTQSGARYAFARSQISLAQFERLAGRPWPCGETDHWEEEIKACWKVSP
jgi:hypothetical protein